MGLFRTLPEKKYFKALVVGGLVVTGGQALHPVRHEEATLPHHPETHQERHDPVTAAGRYVAFSEVSSTSSASPFSGLIRL